MKSQFKQYSGLVLNEKSGNYYVDSRIVAQEIGVEHRALRQLIEKYQKDIENNFSLLTFEMEAVRNEGARGAKNEKYILLTEDQATFVVTLCRNTEKVVKFKMKLTKAFFKLREELRLSNEKNYLDLPKDYPSALRALADKHEENLRLKEDMKENADFINELNITNNEISIGDFATSVGSGRNRMFNWLRSAKYMRPGKTTPYQSFVDQGLFVTTQVVKNGKARTTAYITGKGITKIGKEFIKSQNNLTN